MNGGTCLHETLGKRLPRGRKKNVRCNRSRTGHDRAGRLQSPGENQASPPHRGPDPGVPVKSRSLTGAQFERAPTFRLRKMVGEHRQLQNPPRL